MTFREHQEGALPPKPVAPQLLFVPEGLTQSIFQHKVDGCLEFKSYSP